MSSLHLTRDEVTPEIQAKRELYWEQQRRSLQENQLKSHRLEDLNLTVKVQRPVERCPFGVDRFPELFYECLRDIKSEEEAQQQKILNSLRHQYLQKLLTLEANEQKAAEDKLVQQELERQQAEAQLLADLVELPEDLREANSDIQEDPADGYLNKRQPRDQPLPDRSSSLG